MDKKSIKEPAEVVPSFSNFKSYSVNEIMAAGGTTAFANKLGKNFQEYYDKLKDLPEDAFLTDEEFECALKMLKDNK